MNYRVVRDDGMIIARVDSVFEAGRVAGELRAHNDRHEYFVRTDEGKTVKINASNARGPLGNRFDMPDSGERKTVLGSDQSFGSGGARRGGKTERIKSLGRIDKPGSESV